jgi:hypothetical protein
MAQSGHSSSTHSSAPTSGMDISDQRGTFSAFMSITVWSCLLIAASVAGLVVAFAMNFGWFPGVMTFAIVGGVGGLLMRMGGAWWATLVVSLIALSLGGAVVSGILALV